MQTSCMFGDPTDAMVSVASSRAQRFSSRSEGSHAQHVPREQWGNVPSVPAFPPHFPPHFPRISCPICAKGVKGVGSTAPFLRRGVGAGFQPHLSYSAQ